jgi:hypothetical protein
MAQSCYRPIARWGDKLSLPKFSGENEMATWKTKKKKGCEEITRRWVFGNVR